MGEIRQQSRRAKKAIKRAGRQAERNIRSAGRTIDREALQRVKPVAGPALGAAAGLLIGGPAGAAWGGYAGSTTQGAYNARQYEKAAEKEAKNQLKALESLKVRPETRS